MVNTFFEQAPKIIPVIKSIEDFWVQVILTIVTFLAVLVALFQEKIKDWFNKAKLATEIRLKPPDSHQIDLTDPQTRQFISKSIYVRIRVKNISHKTARNIEILASNLWKYSQNNLHIVKTFLPMNLVWSHTHPVTVTIPPESFRFCDLGSFRSFSGITIFKFDTIVQPNPVSGGILPNVIKPGKYILELLISGDNVKPEIKKWKIKFNRSWSNVESTMLKRVTIKSYKD